MEEHKKEAGIHPIIIGIIASILLHIFIVLISIVLQIKDHEISNNIKNNMTISAKDKQTAIMMLDSPKPQQPKQITQEQTPKSIAPSIIQEPKLISTLIPGRQGKDEQNITKNLIQTEENTEPKLTKIPNTDTDKQPNTDPTTITNPTIQDHNLAHDQIISQSSSQHQSHPTKSNNAQPIHNEILQPINKIQAINNQPKNLEDDDRYKFIPKPTIKPRMSLKDLKLGFNNHLQNIGNTEFLIQLGNTSAAPDESSLKLITYHNKFAKIMIGSIRTHPQFSLIEYTRSTDTVISITIDRQGKLLQSNLITKSNNPLRDKIILESIASAGLYPTVPSYIPNDPVTIQWTFLG